MHFPANEFVLERYDILSDTRDTVAAPIDECQGQTNHYYFGDVDGNNHTDFICHDSVTGVVRIFTALKACSSLEYSPFCYGWGSNTKSLSVGKFLPSKKHDMFLCLIHNTGDYIIRDLLDWNNNLTYSLNKSFCVHGKFLLGDFNLDGIPDLACHVKNVPSIYVLLSNGDGSYDPEKFYPLHASWCYTTAELFLLGDFNGDGMVDFFCLNLWNNDLFTLLADNDGLHLYGNTVLKADAGFCILAHPSEVQLKIGDVNGDGKDDVICHNMVTGEIKITYASTGE